jgi:hypothetical protein
MSEPVDWGEDIDFGDTKTGEPEGDPCTSTACPDRMTCARSKPSAPVSAISDKFLAVSGDVPCYFFDPIADRYPEEMRHILFVWPDHEEDMQCAALGWLLRWRGLNPFILDGDDGHFVMPMKDPSLWLALKDRMLDWAWAEQGGLDLESIHGILIDRHQLRLSQLKVRKPTDFPACVGDNPKVYHHVKQRKPHLSSRESRKGSRAKNDTERTAGSPLFPGHQ